MERFGTRFRAVALKFYCVWGSESAPKRGHKYLGTRKKWFSCKKSCVRTGKFVSKHGNFSPFYRNRVRFPEFEVRFLEIGVKFLEIGVRFLEIGVSFSEIGVTFPKIGVWIRGPGTRISPNRAKTLPTPGNQLLHFFSIPEKWYFFRSKRHIILTKICISCTWVGKIDLPLGTPLGDPSGPLRNPSGPPISDPPGFRGPPGPPKFGSKN